MAVLATIASGNWDSSTTWGLVDSTSYTPTEGGTANTFQTVYSVSSRTAAFTPGAITVSHIGFKMFARNGSTGTLSLHIALNSTHVEVAGTEVTINVSDLPAISSGSGDSGWIFLKLASPVTLLSSTAYEIEGKTSSSTQVTPMRVSTNFQQFCTALITTTNQAPASGDVIIVNGEYTGAATSNSFTVTMNETGSTSYGNSSTNITSPSLSICSKGTLSYETNASTNYSLKISGHISVYYGGIFNIGTSVNPIPSSSTAKLIVNAASAANFSIITRGGSKMNAYGSPRTSGKLVYACTLTSDVAINGTTFNVNADTGWLNNDDIVIASTTRTYNQSEVGKLSANAGTSSFTVKNFGGVGGGVANSHSGTSPVQADIVLLNRNISIEGISTTATYYMQLNSTSISSFYWTQFIYYGSGNSNQQGVLIGTTTGSCEFNYCSFRDGQSSSTSLTVPTTGQGYSSVDNFDVNNCVFANIGNRPINFGESMSWTPTSTKLRNIYIIKNLALNPPLAVFPNYLTEFHDIVISSSFTVALDLKSATNSSNNFMRCDWYNFKIYSNNNIGINFASRLILNPSSYKIYNLYVFRNNSQGLVLGSSNSYVNIGVTFDNINIFGNNTQNIVSNYSGVIDSTISNSIIASDTTFSSTIGLINSSNSYAANLKIINTKFGAGGGIYTTHSTSDISGLDNTQFTPHMKILLLNSVLGSSTEVAFPSSTCHSKNMISSQKHDQTNGLHKTWTGAGILTIENSITKSGAKSLKMTPFFSTKKLESSGYYGGFKVPILSGQTCIPLIWVYEDASYNGSRARLILKKNDALGITSDIIIANATSASDLAWEKLTGFSPSVNANGVLEFVVDCDGTAGNIYIDEFSATV